MDLINTNVVAFFAFLAFIALFVALIFGWVWFSRRKKTFSPFTEDMLRLPGHSVRQEHMETAEKVMYFYIEYVLTGVVLMKPSSSKSTVAEVKRAEVYGASRQ